MSTVSRVRLAELITVKDDPCVSIFLSTHRVTAGSREDQIRFGNLLRKARKKLAEKGLRRLEAEQFLAAAQALLENPLFWQYQYEGLAVFVGPNFFQYFRLPFDPGEFLSVGGSFITKPLFPMLTDHGHFFILALSQNEVRLLIGSRHAVDEVELESIPASLEEALGYDSVQKQLQFHTGTSAGTGRRAAMFHGHGVGNDEGKDNILRYFRKIDDGLREVLRGERVPLVLAGVEHLFSIYREANTYPHLFDRGIPGNPEELSAEYLRAKAWALLAPYFGQQEHSAALKYKELVPSKRTSTDMDEIVKASLAGRVELLFVEGGAEARGTFDPETERAEGHAEQGFGDPDLVDVAVVYTYLSGGMIYIMDPEEMPDSAPVAGVLKS